MAKRTQTSKKTKVIKKKPLRKDQKKPKAKSTLKNKYRMYGLLILLCAVTWLSYLSSPSNGYTNWDDHVYVTQNEDLSPLSEKLPLLLRSNYSGNYHPITMLSLAADKAIDDNPRSFHLTSMVIHIINVLLLFLLIKLLSGNLLLAFFVSLFFGIHPMHVESVAWISARKDLLYGMFFFAGLITYLKYLNTKNMGFYALTILLALASGLSKPAAVVFPLFLILLLYYKDRKIKKELLLLTPFFVISLIIAWLNYGAQESAGAVAESMSIPERLITALYGLGFYLEKAVLPFGLSAFHPFPKGGISSMFVIRAILGLGILVLFIWSYLKKKKTLFLGLGIYITSLILVLQLIPFGAAIVAERYTYLAYVGLFLVIIYYLNKFIRNENRSWLLFSVLAIPCIWLTTERVKVWKDSGTLWTDALKTYPKANKSLNNRGTFYLDTDQDQLALQDFQKLIEYAPQTEKAHYNRATAYYNLGSYEASMADYREALRREPNSTSSLYGVGNVYNRTGKLDSALLYYDMVLYQDPDHYRALGNKASIFFQTSQFQNALDYYNRVLALNTEDLIVFKNKGATLLQLGRYDEAIRELDYYLSLQPDAADAIYYKAICFEKKGELAKAIEFAEQAYRKGLESVKSYIDRLKAASST